MKFVALISGGKDSFYNIMQCMKNGHTLLALANLHPHDSSVNELDSFMFQTVGHDIIEYYRQCIDGDIPLYRRSITGGSSNVALEYEVTSDDEIEDLYELLKLVKEAHPDVQGVSCGAILSHYQRTRVENVCDRLNLTCLAYLWQSDQAQLMLEMCLLGLDAILIKVAAIGLTEKHLGKLLSEMYPILTRLNTMYDVHVCGEGGEFESLVLDTPFFTKKLRVKELKVFHHSLDASYLSLIVEVVEKENQEKQDLGIEFPSLLLEEFRDLTEGLGDLRAEISTSHQSSIENLTFQPRITKSKTKLYFGNLTSDTQTVEEQTQGILLKIRELLKQNDCLFSQIQHMTVLVQDMADFSKINSVYETFFKNLFLPPSRVCVETALPASCKLKISCEVLKTKNTKEGIHIRSRSYWAPQNIGPYSQAIVDTRETLKFATLSGQIPLIPQSMIIDPEMPVDTQISLSLQHLHKVKALIKVEQVASFVCYITQKTSPKLVSEIWKRYINEFGYEKDFYERLLIVEVTALPRDASVEWGGLSYEKIFDMYADDSDDDIIQSTEPHTEIITPFKTVSVTLGDMTLLKFTGNDINDLIDFLRNPIVENTFVNVLTDLDTIHELSNTGVSAQWTPVLNVYDNDGSKCKYGVSWMR